uniref:Uncharacterized protein LOC116948858 isoform X3 n=1 Tax=Petromyzon marinus TaxID=7757 RepID=A0AAJ7TPZ5_PETMA|nr:uncharacterized protein LOC116948858 isoform X3 [Petromyzon marinus]
MRLLDKLLQARVQAPLEELEYLDVSDAHVGWLEELGNCPNVQALLARGNALRDLDSLSRCSRLWHLDLQNNQLECVAGLGVFVALGSLDLSGNLLQWQSLHSLRPLHVLNLRLHGNPALQRDPHYRVHAVDSLPRVWSLDGLLATSTERLRVEQYVQDAALSPRPIRRKFSRMEIFVPSSRHNLMQTCSYGERTLHFMRRFPLEEPHNVGLDQRRLSYLAYTAQGQAQLEWCSTKGERLGIDVTGALESLVHEGHKEQERRGTLLVLLTAALEFHLPCTLVQQALRATGLSHIREIDTSDLLRLPRKVQLRVASLLLSAVHLGRDAGQVERLGRFCAKSSERRWVCAPHAPLPVAFAPFRVWQTTVGSRDDMLHLALYYVLAGIAWPKAVGPRNGRRSDARMAMAQHLAILAAEACPLLCKAPVFFTLLGLGTGGRSGGDAGLERLLRVATGDPAVFTNLAKLLCQTWADHDRADSADPHVRVSNFLLGKLWSGCLPRCSNPGARHINPHCVLVTGEALPRRPVSGILRSTETLHKGLRSPLRRKPRTWSAIPALAQSRERRRPALGDLVLMGPQLLGRIVALPRPGVGLVLLQAPAARVGGCYRGLRLADVTWDAHAGQWRPSAATGDRVTLSIAAPWEDRSVTRTGTNSPRSFASADDGVRRSSLTARSGGLESGSETGSGSAVRLGSATGATELNYAPLVSEQQQQQQQQQEQQQQQPSNSRGDTTPRHRGMRPSTSRLLSFSRPNTARRGTSKPIPTLPAHDSADSSSVPSILPDRSDPETCAPGGPPSVVTLPEVEEDESGQTNREPGGREEQRVTAPVKNASGGPRSVNSGGSGDIDPVKSCLGDLEQVGTGPGDQGQLHSVSGDASPGENSPVDSVLVGSGSGDPQQMESHSRDTILVESGLRNPGLVESGSGTIGPVDRFSGHPVQAESGSVQHETNESGKPPLGPRESESQPRSPDRTEADQLAHGYPGGSSNYSDGGDRPNHNTTKERAPGRSDSASSYQARRVAIWRHSDCTPPDSERLSAQQRALTRRGAPAPIWSRLLPEARSADCGARSASVQVANQWLEGGLRSLRSAERRPGHAPRTAQESGAPSPAARRGGEAGDSTRGRKVVSSYRGRASMREVELFYSIVEE